MSGPAGRLAKGFPEESGFGHEEWNNSPRLRYTKGGTPMRAFHTEAVWNYDEDEAIGNVIVLMYASYERVQVLVGAAARARCLMHREPERLALSKRLQIATLNASAWKQPTVRAAFHEDRSAFDARWESEHTWIPNWTCPSEYFFQPHAPVALDPMRIRNTSKLLTMFGKYTKLDVAEGLRVMLSVPHSDRDSNWARIAAALGGQEDGSATLPDDVGDVLSDPSTSKTTKQALVDARLGQGRFRKQVAAKWEGACSVTGCTQQELLRASHMKPWWQSSCVERLDQANGLYLCANLDALFDRYLVSFSTDGRMMVSSKIEQETRDLLGLPAPLRRKPTDQELVFLQHHRTVFEEREAAAVAEI